MVLEFDITIKFSNLYDYMMYFTYTSMQGIIGTLAGIFFLVEFFLSFQPIFLIAGVIILVYVPGSLFLKAKQQSLNPVYKKPIHYKFTEEGIELSQDDQVQMQKWEDIYKAGSSLGSILIYTGRRNASIFPKRQLMEQDIQSKVMEMISTHLPPKKVNIR